MSYCVTIGTFDGVHRGHQRLVRHLVGSARRWAMEPRVLLFEEPPRFFFDPAARRPLLTLPGERAALLMGLGVASVDTLRFGAAVARMGRERFLDGFLLGRLKAAGIVVGPDFAFGRGRAGTVTWLAEACRERGARFKALPLLCEGGLKVSSTRIRELLEGGHAAEAAALLGRPHFIEAPVARGRGLGRRLGFPTANLKLPRGKLVPRGVYRVRVRPARPGPSWRRPRLGALSAGTRPTLGGGALSVEVHIPGFSGDLYGRSLRVEFLGLIRPERRFPDLEALRRQIALDVRSLRR